MKAQPASAAAALDLAPLCLRAELGTLDSDARTVDMVFSTGAAVERYDWMSGKRYLEKLSMDTKAVRLDRLNSSAPLLDAHSAWSVSDILGAVVPGTAAVEKGRGVATVKFSARQAVADILQDVRDGIIRSVSVGYRVHKYEEEETSGKLPVRTAIDWEPYEISMVPMPADVGAKVRSQQIQTNTCIIVRRHTDADRQRRFRLALAHSRGA